MEKTMVFIKKPILALCTLLGIASCSGINVTQYQHEKPVLDLRQYFNGTIDAYGMFQNRSGEVVKRFHVLIDAHWEGDTGVLDERFSYSDGTKQQRIWTIKKTANNEYVGQAADVVGEAKGNASGNALRWQYVLSLPVDGKVYEVDFDDWMFQMDDKIMMNRSAMSKWGFHLGDVTLTFVRR